MTNGGRRARLDEIQRIADALREPVEAPDLSSAILARVDSQRCFLSRKGRAIVWAGRGAAALTIVLVVMGFTLASRYAPQTIQVAAQPTPVSEVVTAVSSQATQQLTALRFSLEPNRGQEMEITSILAGVAPINELAQPIGAAIHAVRFVGPPQQESASDTAWLASDWHIMPSHRVSRLPNVSLVAAPREVRVQTADDDAWFEEESPLLQGIGSDGPLAPK